MGRSVAVVCPKGGVGKTTIAVNLAATLAEKGKRCLLVGIDPQCGIVSCFGKSRFDIDNGLLDFFDLEGDPGAAIQPSGTANLDFITSNVWSREEERELQDGAQRFPERLAAQVERLKRSYDCVLLDCPPNLGALTSAALQAADDFLVPLQAEELAYRALPRLFDGLDEMRRQGRRIPGLLGIVLNLVDPRTRLAADVVARVREEYAGQVFTTVIPRSVRLAEVAKRGRPVNQFNRSGLAATAFGELADELLGAFAAGQGSLKAAVVDELQALGLGSAEFSLTPPVPVKARALEGAAALVGDPDPAEADWALEAAPEEGFEREDDERFVSLEDVLAGEDDDGSGNHRPSLDDYDGGSEDDYYH
ncbi:ParA family protein [bacterium]|nr:ParA family protein [bacterium]